VRRGKKRLPANKEMAMANTNADMSKFVFDPRRAVISRSAVFSSTVRESR
jgi:hypothetical protein